jgi:hypothetical protein
VREKMSSQKAVSPVTASVSFECFVSIKIDELPTAIS